LRLLLDTHIVLWALLDDPRMPQAARALILDPAAEICVSAASIWEIAIKHSLARGLPDDMPITGAQGLHWCRRAGYTVLPVTGEHAAAAGALPQLHRDPFDRLLVVQALHEPMRLLTHDPAVKAYDAGIVLV
jgi:PIN domain nuclease of toxin-antitoxin system